MRRKQESILVEVELAEVVVLEPVVGKTHFLETHGKRDIPVRTIYLSQETQGTHLPIQARR